MKIKRQEQRRKIKENERGEKGQEENERCNGENGYMRG